MSYTINLTSGPVISTVSDGTVDNKQHTSLVLIGKNYPGYGRFINENFVQLLENFAYTSGPINPLKGQLWWDTGNNILRVWSGTSWKISTGATSSKDAPGDLSNLGGDLWFDSVNGQLKVWNGTNAWITIGPTSTLATGDTSVLPALMSDSQSGASKVVIQFKINGTIYAVFSKEIFNSTLNGFPVVHSGLTFNNATGGPTMEFSTNGDIYCNILHGTANYAQYADLAERFESDVEIEPGTVVELGGAAEITISEQELSENVFGVISTRAAYLMNSRAGTDSTHPPVAVQGRVPVKVIGKISKGDRLVSAGKGLARAGKRKEINTWNVIGRSLEDKADTGVGVVEAVVKINS
jgi:hypothetical protein